jgi:hypothetical protein
MNLPDSPPPGNMDEGSRNERLYQYLLGMGLVVRPRWADDDPTRMVGMFVSAGLPAAQNVPQNAAKRRVDLAVQRAEVGENVQASNGTRGTVIDFPSPLR